MSSESSYRTCQSLIKFWEGNTKDVDKDENMIGLHKSNHKKQHEHNKNVENFHNTHHPLPTSAKLTLAEEGQGDRPFGTEETPKDENVKRIVSKINKSVECGDISELLNLLKSPSLKLMNYIHPFAASLYYEELDYIRKNSGIDIQQHGIAKVCIFLSIVAQINEAAHQKNYDMLFALVSDERANLEDLCEEKKEKYGEAMHTALVTSQRIFNNLEKGTGGMNCKLLNHADLQDCIDMVNSEELDYQTIQAVQQVNEAIRKLDYILLFKALQNPNLELEKNLCLRQNIPNLRESCTPQFLSFSKKKALIQEKDSLHFLALLRDLQRERSYTLGRQTSQTSTSSCDAFNTGNLIELWMDDILLAVEQGLDDASTAKSAAIKLSEINIAISLRDPYRILQLLKCEELNAPQNALVIQNTRQNEYVEALGETLKTKEDSGARCVWIKHDLSNCSRKDVITTYLNLKDLEHAWSKPEEYRGTHSSCYLCLEEIMFTINRTNRIHSKGTFQSEFESQFVKFQGRCRGFLVRKKLFLFQRYYKDREHLIAKLQAYWRGKIERRNFKKLKCEKIKLRGKTSHLRSLAFYRMNEDKIIRIQRAWREYKNDADFRAILLQGDGQNMEHISVAQVRRYLHLLDLRRDDFDQELQMQNLKGDITKKIRMNNQLEKDINTMDIKIGLLVKNRIDVQEVVAHSKLLSKSTSIATANKTGNVQDDKKADNSWTYTSARTLEKLNKPYSAANQSPAVKRGLKALKRESREKLEAYQNLFYQLQTQPEHLAKLIHVMPQSNSTKFMESVLLTLYNYGANQREEYLLLKLFKTALEEEIAEKVVHPADIVTGNPLVIKMVISFYRVGNGGKSSLHEILGPLICQVLEDKTLQINISPIDIYKAWVNSIEFESGKAAGMPYDVTTEDALQYEEVRKRLARSISKLKQVTTMFLATIVKARHRLPYGLLYIAQVLRNALKRKFSTCAEKDILKIVGNLLYYRFLNSAIVAPDAFVDIKKNTNINDEKKTLNNDQRRNLGSVAKVLQAAAMKKGFGEEAPHLEELNNYIVEAHAKFKSFFLECCEQTKDPETYFHINAYSDLTMLGKPIIYISLQEICDTHRLLLQHRDQIMTPKSLSSRRQSNSGNLSESDKLNELLNDLKGEPSLCSLVGAASHMYGEGSNEEDKKLSNLAKTEVCLTLTNKFTLPPVDRGDMDRLFIKTKQLLCSVLPCTAFGQGVASVTNRREDVNLIGCLKSKTVREQEEVYWRLMAAKEAADERATKHQQLDHTNLFEDDESRLPLEDCKRQILKNLQILERHGYVSSKDGCKSIVVSLATDIINRKHYRSRRRTELLRLHKIIQNLEKKTTFHEEQIEYYQVYLQQCLANLQSSAYRTRRRKKKVTFTNYNPASSDTGDALAPTTKHSNNSNPIHDRSKHKVERKILRYSALKLHDKGILIEIDGLPINQFRNVLFEIVPAVTDLEDKENFDRVPKGSDGRFEIHAKFMGVRLEHVDIDIQELLQLQYEGVAVMNIFGKAKINVNLLLHLLNVKFFGRKRK